MAYWGYQMKWGDYEFAPKPNDHIGLIDLKITNSYASSENSTTEGNTENNAKGMEPITVTFSLMYVLGHTDQTLEDLAEFWQNEVRMGIPRKMVWGGDRAPDLTPNYMQLMSAPYSITQHGGGTIATLKIDFTFKEVKEPQTEANTNYTTADYIPN